MVKPNETDNRRVNALLGADRQIVAADISSPEDLAALRAEWAKVEGSPVVCAVREDGVDQSWQKFDIRTYVRGEQSGGRLTVHSVKLAPGGMLPAHYHADADTFVMVIEGFPKVQVGDTIEAAGPYSFAFAPENTRLAIENPTDENIWFNLVYLGAGKERAFAEARNCWLKTGEGDFETYRAILERHGFCFDSTELANDKLTNVPSTPVEFDFAGEGDLERLRTILNERPAMPRLVHTSADEIAVDGPDIGFRKLILSGDDGGGKAMLNFLARIPPAPKHYQPTEDEIFFILDGSLKMTCATAEVVLQRGAVAYVPPNCTHGFGPPAPGVDHKFMTLNTPGGHEHAMGALRKKMKGGMSPDEFWQFAAAGGFIFHDR